MRLNKAIKVVLPLGLLLLLGPSQPVNIWIPQWTQITGTYSEPLQQPARNAGNAAPPLGSNNIFSQLPDRAAALWVPSGKDGVGPLHAIDALSPNDIWAVGETLDNPSKALVAHWDGEQWSTAARIDPDSSGPRSSSGWDRLTMSKATLMYGRNYEEGARFFAVAALASNDVWAVGEYHVFRDHMGGAICCWIPQVLITHWDGRTWQTVPSSKIQQMRLSTESLPSSLPYYLGDTLDKYGSLRAVVAVSPDDIWAVGQRYIKPLALHWDGITWNRVPIPDNIAAHMDALNDVDMTSSNDVWAVGAGSIIHWDGIGWSESHELESQGNVLPGFQSVAALSQDDAWVVGSGHWSGALEHSRLLFLHWDGTAWTDISTALYCDDLRRGCNLISIHAVSKSDIWAVGQGLEEALVMHWNGSFWSVHNCPAKGLSSVGSLSDVVVTAPGEVLAVGGGSRILGQAVYIGGFALRLGIGACPPPPTPTSIPTEKPWPTPIPIQTRVPSPTPTFRMLLPELPTIRAMPMPIGTQGSTPMPVQTYVSATTLSLYTPVVSVGAPSRITHKRP